MYYPSGTGGKFLLNCLALSDDAVFQDHLFAMQDLKGKLSVEEKFFILEDRILNESALNWKDLDMGDVQLFGIEKKLFCKTFIKNEKLIFPVVAELSKSNKIFFLTCHSRLELEIDKDIFPNLTIVQFINTDTILKRRNKKYKLNPPPFIKDWEIVKGSTWGSPPATIDDFYHCYEINEIKECFPKLYYKIIKWFELQKLESEIVGNYFWDCNNFLKETDFLIAIDKLSTELRINLPNQLYIKKFYNLWYDINFN